MGKIDELWIINPYGITLFNFSKSKNGKSALIGGFFSGLQKFLKEIESEELRSINSGKSKFTFYQNDGGFLFIIRTGNKVEDKEINKHLKLVGDKFFENYEDILRNWDGKLDYFDNFNKIVEEINCFSS